MKWTDYLLALIGTIAVGFICAWIDDRDQQLILPEIEVHGHSSTN